MKTKSLKGKWGHVGAPPKPLKAYPRTRFTIAQIVARNESVCELTIRKRIKADVKAGKLVTLPVIPQAGGAVGRPKFAFQLKELATKSKPAKTTRTPRKTATVATVTIPAPVTPITTPAVTTPVVKAPVTPVTPVITP